MAKEIKLKTREHSNDILIVYKNISVKISKSFNQFISEGYRSKKLLYKILEQLRVLTRLSKVSNEWGVFFNYFNGWKY